MTTRALAASLCVALAVGLLAGSPAGAGATTGSTAGRPASVAAVVPAGPSLSVSVAATGLDRPWDLAVAPDGSWLFTERAGQLKVRLPSGSVRRLSADLSDLYVQGETGLLGVALDPSFASSRRFYTCQGARTGASTADVRVVAWTVDLAWTTATRVANPLVSGMPITYGSGRHGGCRLRFDATGALIVGTGDAAVGTNPQDLTSLGGKTLRVDAATGGAAPGNPFASSPNPQTRLIWTYGHRNVQGLALRPSDGSMWSVEHGTSRDDEVNLLGAGLNYGWNPVPGYDESKPMTDGSLGLNVRGAAWSSGAPTLATSGADFITSTAWAQWNGALAVAGLKRSALMITTLSPSGQVLSTAFPPELDGVYGRLRVPVMAPSGDLIITTDNGGGGDKILLVRPAGRAFGVQNGVVPDPVGAAVWGWAIDPTKPTAAAVVQVSVDGATAAWARADQPRSDVAVAHPEAGPAHGYGVAVPAAPGRRTVCTTIWAVDLSSTTPGGCAAVSVPSGPIGGLGGSARLPEGLAIWGWALDTRSAEPSVVQVGLDGVTAAWVRADKSRPDIAAAWPRWGSQRGWSLVWQGAPPRQVCAWVWDAAMTRRASIGCATGG